MLTNTCILSYTELLRAKAETLYNAYRCNADVPLPTWKELCEQTRLEWISRAKCYAFKRQNKTMP